MITFLFPTHKMDMENLDDLCALRPRELLNFKETSETLDTTHTTMSAQGDHRKVWHGAE